MNFKKLSFSIFFSYLLLFNINFCNLNAADQEAKRQSENIDEENNNIAKDPELTARDIRNRLIKSGAVSLEELAGLSDAAMMAIYNLGVKITTESNITKAIGELKTTVSFLLCKAATNEGRHKGEIQLLSQQLNSIAQTIIYLESKASSLKGENEQINKRIDNFFKFQMGMTCLKIKYLIEVSKKLGLLDATMSQHNQRITTQEKIMHNLNSQVTSQAQSIGKYEADINNLKAKVEDLEHSKSIFNIDNLKKLHEPLSVLEKISWLAYPAIAFTNDKIGLSKIPVLGKLSDGLETGFKGVFMLSALYRAYKTYRIFKK